MMPSIQKIQKLLSRYMHTQTMRKRDLVEPVRDWLIGLIVVTVLFVCGVVYVVIDFYAQIEVSHTPVDVSVEAVSYPERDVLYYAELYEKRAAHFNELRGITHTPLFVPEVEVPLAEDLVAQ